MKEYGVWEPQIVKTQSIKTAVESACLLLRVDDVVSGFANREQKAERWQVRVRILLRSEKVRAKNRISHYECISGKISLSGNCG